MTTRSHTQIQAINERLAIEVMGWHKDGWAWRDNNDKLHGMILAHEIDPGKSFHWNPMSDIGQAMMLVEKLANSHIAYWTLQCFSPHGNDPRYLCTVKTPWMDETDAKWYKAPSEAICLAAIKALEETRPSS